MQRIRFLVLMTAVTGLLPATLASTEDSPSGGHSAEPATETTHAVVDESPNFARNTHWMLWPLGVAEFWLVGWLAIWFTGRCLAPTRVRHADKWFGQFPIGGLQFRDGTRVTAAHLVLVRVFATPMLADERPSLIDKPSGQSLAGIAPDEKRRPATNPIDNSASVAAPAIGSLPRMPAIAGTVSHEITPGVIERLADAVHRRNAVSMLARLDHTLRASVAVSVDDSDVETQRLAVMAIAELDETVVKPLNRALENNVPGMRPAVAQALERLGPIATNLIPGLTHLLRDSNADCRHGAVVALGWLGSRSGEAAPVLTELVTDENCVVRAAATQALEAIGEVSSATIGALCIGAQDNEQAVRAAAIRALGKLGVGWPEAVPPLRAALSDDDPTIRQLASESLGCLGPLAKGAMGDLGRLMSDSSVLVRRSVAKALSRIDLAAVPMLSRALEDEDAEVRRIAAAALSGIGLAAIPALISSFREETPASAGSAGSKASDPLPVERERRDPATDQQISGSLAIP